MSLLEQDTTKKKQVKENIIKFNPDNIKKYKAGEI